MFHLIVFLFLTQLVLQFSSWCMVSALLAMNPALLNITAGHTETVTKTFVTALYLPDNHHHWLSSSEAISGSVITGGDELEVASVQMHRRSCRLEWQLLCSASLCRPQPSYCWPGLDPSTRIPTTSSSLALFMGGNLWVSGIFSLPWCLLYSPICFSLFVCLSLWFGMAQLSTQLPNCCSADTPATSSLPVINWLFNPSIHQTWFLSHSSLDSPVCTNTFPLNNEIKLNLNFYKPISESFFSVLN